MANIYIVGLGTSHPNGMRYLSQALELLHLTKSFHVDAKSDIVTSGGVGTKDALTFRNAAVCITSTLSPFSLWLNLRVIESKLGRIRLNRNSPRTMDLDILWWSNGEYRDAFVTLPHPRLFERKFAFELAREVLAKAPRNLVRPLNIVR